MSIYFSSIGIAQLGEASSASCINLLMRPVRYHLHHCSPFQTPDFGSSFVAAYQAENGFSLS